MFCVVASGLYCALVPSACCHATIARTFSLVTGMPSCVRKSCAHCSRFVVAGPAGVVAVVPVVAWACASALEKSVPDVPLDDVDVEVAAAPVGTPASDANCA